MECHVVAKSTSICCESLETARNTLDDEQEPIYKELEPLEPKGPNPLKYTPDEVARIQDEHLIQQQLESAIIGKLNKIQEKKDLLKEKKEQISEQKQKKKPRNYADNENTRRINFDEASHEKIHQQKKKVHENPTTTAPSTTSSQSDVIHPKAFGVRTNVHVNKDRGIEYEPHTQGGYAISRQIERPVHRPISPERRAQAQEFIMEQIRQGWPYDEKFYRPESKFK